MEWLTRKEIREAAKKSEEAAVKCSIKHWEQIRDATRAELTQGYDNDRVISNHEFCALCKRYFKFKNNSPCENCILYKIGKGCLGYGIAKNVGVYEKAREAFWDKMELNKSNRIKDFNRMINALKKCLK